jgi:hypothetical protein
MHYNRWLRTGDPTKIRRIPTRAGLTTEQILSRFVDDMEADGCWLWTGFLSTAGYGRIDGTKKGVWAHRWAYEQLVGPIPEGYHLDHLCHTTDLTCSGGGTCTHRRCVNPAHLEPVTPQENNARRLRRPRKAPAHGRRSTYTHHGCRCDACKAASAAYLREWKRRRYGCGGPL